ncbi:MAG: HNH endonuclease [Acidimicrobiales bacterium]
MRPRALAVVGLLVSSCAGVDALSPSLRPPPSPAPMAEVLATPRVAVPDPARTRYDRAAYQPRGWGDADGDGCNTREEVLLLEGEAVRTGPGCRVLGGHWQDPFTGRRTTWPGDLQVDHLVALADAYAHASGGWAWPDERKVAFADDLGDPDELDAVWGAENEAKADHGPDRWLPPDEKARCWYVAAYARIKARWDLSVTPAQWAAVSSVWAACGPRVSP